MWLFWLKSYYGLWDVYHKTAVKEETAGVPFIIVRFIRIVNDIPSSCMNVVELLCSPLMKASLTKCF